jgi:protein involved in polysaccharide export with SLBB domain
VAVALLALALAVGPAARVASGNGLSAIRGSLAESRSAPQGIDTEYADDGRPEVFGGGVLMPANSAQPGAVDPTEYVVGPGDVFLLNLTGSVTHAFTLPVGPEGTLFLPAIGSVNLAGLTLAQARTEVLHRIAAQYRGVTADFRLTQARTMQVYLTGSVRLPGPVTVEGYGRIADVLTDALLMPDASRRNIVIHRHARTPATGTDVVADLVRFRLTGDMSGNPRLRDADVIYVPAVRCSVEVRGAVPHPDTYELGSSDSLRTLIALAGDPLPSANGEGLLLRFRDSHTTDSTSFRLDDVMSGAFSPALRDGDHVFLYLQPRFHVLEQAAIEGEVRRPGAYPLVPGRTRLTDLVHAAGGFLDRANLASIRVFRGTAGSHDADPEVERLAHLSRHEMTSSEYEVLRSRITAQREAYRIDWARLQQLPELDVVMQDGDIVRVEPVVAWVRVEGEVRRPGVVTFDPSRSIADYVRLSGGFSRRAARGQVRVTRSITGQSILGRDVGALSSGDLIWVPERGEVPVWQTTQAVILVLAQVATVILAIKR